MGASPSSDMYLADLCGDGLTDLLRIRNGEVCYWPNLGYGRFGAKVTMDNAPWFDNPDQFEQRRIRLADTILVRRSHTLKDEYMKTTKTGLRQRITVPSEVMDVLRWHVQSQLLTPEQRDSELLFPAEDGGFRSDRFLTKAFAAAVSSPE